MPGGVWHDIPPYCCPTTAAVSCPNVRCPFSFHSWRWHSLCTGSIPTLEYSPSLVSDVNINLSLYCPSERYCLLKGGMLMYQRLSECQFSGYQSFRLLVPLVLAELSPFRPPDTLRTGGTQSF